MRTHRQDPGSGLDVRGRLLVRVLARVVQVPKQVVLPRAGVAGAVHDGVPRGQQFRNADDHGAERRQRSSRRCGGRRGRGGCSRDRPRVGVGTEGVDRRSAAVACRRGAALGRIGHRGGLLGAGAGEHAAIAGPRGVRVGGGGRWCAVMRRCLVVWCDRRGSPRGTGTDRPEGGWVHGATGCGEESPGWDRTGWSYVWGGGVGTVAACSDTAVPVPGGADWGVDLRCQS